MLPSEKDLSPYSPVLSGLPGKRKQHAGIKDQIYSLLFLSKRQQFLGILHEVRPSRESIRTNPSDQSQNYISLRTEARFLFFRDRLRFKLRYVTLIYATILTLPAV